jgi:hypothetical protein
VSAPETYRVATEVAFVTTEDGEAVRLGEGDTLPENVHPDELARLLNGGVIEGYDAVPSLLDPDDDTLVVDEELLAGNIDAIKLRIGTDAVAARAYLDAEQGAAKPRPTLVKHLEEVIAADDTPKVSSADVTATEGE